MSAKKKKKKISIKEFSKRIMLLIIIISLIDIQICIFMRETEIANTFIISVIAEFGIYSVKAFFGKKEKEHNKLEQQIIDLKKENRNEL